MPGGRPTKDAARAGFEAEVLRLYKAGKEIGNRDKPGTISAMLDADRTTIWRVVKKGEKNQKPAEVEALKQERAYARQTNDAFAKEPAIAELIEDMKLRRVKGISKTIGWLRRICEDLQIYPDQLVPSLDPESGDRDFTWGKKWLGMKTEIPLDKLREPKKAFRALAKKYGATDYELQIAGFDAKHYGVGKWKHVQMTDEQAKAVEACLEDAARFPDSGREEALFAFKFGLETCRPLEPIWGLTSDQFYTIPLEDGTVLYAVNVFRKKTEKSGAPYKTAYVSKKTYELAKALGARNGAKIMDGFEPKAIYRFLRAAYYACGVRALDPENPNRDYFQEHPTHALRHSGAQRLLRKTNFNRAVVAELGGWESETTLEDHYGGVPVDVIRGVARDLL